MSKGETKIAMILASVASGKYTVARLKTVLAEGVAHVEAHGVINVERELIENPAALESAIQWIEREKAKYTQ